ncbi:MAG: carbohydrate binding domain-containing protein [Phycisphaerales bacterium]
MPFVIPLRIDPSQKIWTADYEPIAINSERLTAHGGHFSRGRQLRIWGVNLCFGANFPTHEDAPLVATRLAAAGVNSVRLHHMDTSRWPAGIWNAQDGRTIEPKALDRLDYFINELATRGIFINVNLHVGYKHSEPLGLPTTNREFDKIYGIFTPALIDAQKQYARDILTHVNPYRKVRYADDPAVAFVEITNEDSFFMWDGEETLRTLPPYYAGILRGQFNSWLGTRYASDEALAAAWGKGTEPLGENMLQNSSFLDWDAAGSMPRHWNLEQHEDCRATLAHPQGLPKNAMQIDIAKANETQWHLQLTQGGFKVTAGRYYMLSFEAASSRNRQIGCVVSQAHDPWGNLGLSRSVEMGTDWQTFKFGFVATADDDNARISFAFSGDSTPFQFAHVELHPGGQVGLAEGESAKAGSVELFRDCESTARVLDRMIFLAETEKAYFDGMRSYIKNDLGCGALVTGTIVFGPLGLYAQSDMDFIDSHSYWEHPSFPGRAWDSNNWLIRQRPMTDYPEQATLFRIAAERLAGKPFTLSEYNHPAPLDAQAECVPMVASFAAAQDWDGIWLFTYSHATDNWGRETMSGFFDMDTNPAKWGFMRAGAALFRDRCITPLNGFAYSALTDSKDVAAGLATLHLKHNGNMLAATGFSREDLLTRPQIATLTGRRPDVDTRGSSTEIEWTVEDGKGLYAVRSWSGSAYAGHATRFQDATDGKISIIAPEFVALTMTALGGKAHIPIGARDLVLVTACGRCENVGMQFSSDRRTVGRNWGGPPAQIEAVEGTVVLPDGQWTCHALAPDGTKRQPVPIAYENGRGVLSMSPEYGTMWYLLERQSQ